MNLHKIPDTDVSLGTPVHRGLTPRQLDYINRRMRATLREMAAEAKNRPTPGLRSNKTSNWRHDEADYHEDHEDGGTW